MNWIRKRVLYWVLDLPGGLRDAVEWAAKVSGQPPHEFIRNSALSVAQEIRKAPAPTEDEMLAAVDEYFTRGGSI